jgi:endonuclease/exonuclease/phosphatase family metal-dependent hydrolase
MATISLASYNTHFGVLPVRHAPRPPYDVTAAIASLDADVVVIQESLRPDRARGAVDDAAALLGYDLLYEATGPTSGDPGWPQLQVGGTAESGISVLSRLPARRVGTLIVGPTPLDPAPLRTVLDVELDLGDATLRVIAVHLTSRLPFGPPQQMRRMARLVPPPGTPTVVVGDHNFWGPGVVTCMRGWKRGVTGRTWPAHRPHSQIDHILYRPGDLEILEGRVLPNIGSDHRPVRVVLRVEPADPGRPDPGRPDPGRPDPGRPDLRREEGR